jgi:phage terminase large subunit
MQINFKPNKKQFKAWELLSDNETTQILYGGGASGGKTFLGCVWIILSALKYPNSRWLKGRSKLNTLKTTTLVTFNDILKMWDLTDKFKINHQTNTISCVNGSEILLKDLFSYPSDPDFDSLGSLEITGCFIDECNQISSKAFEIIQTRIRYKLTEFKITGKCLASCNPSKGWVYTTFYKPHIDGKLPEYRKYIAALATDNPNTEPAYIESLRRASESTKQRLLYGSWDYSDDVDSLFRYKDIIQYKNVIPGLHGEMYISADIARLGKDRTILMVWDGLTVIEIIQLEGVTTNISTAKILELCNKYNISMRNVIIDADGIGGGVVDQLNDVKSFINNSKPIEVYGSPNVYQNLKSQCYYKLAEYTEDGVIKISNINNEDFEILCQELQAIKQKDYDKDGKLSVIPKDEMKRILGRSPDYADAMMMRMFFEIKDTGTKDWSLLF